MLLTLMKNEFIKIFKRGKTWIIFGLFLAFISLTIYGTWKSAEDRKYWSSPEYQIQMSEENLQYSEEAIKNAQAENDKEWELSLESSIQYYNENIEYYKNILENGIDETQWVKDLDEQVVQTQEIITNYEKEGINDYNKREYSSLKSHLEFLTYLKDNNIKPLEGGEYTSHNFLSNTSMFLGLGLLVAGIAVFMSDIVSGESTPPTMKFLLVQPVSRGKILLSKYLVSVITVLLLIVIPQIIGLGVVNATSDINVSNYPVIVDQEYEKVFSVEENEMILKEIPDTSEIITMNEFAVKSLGFQSLFVFAASSVIFMFSTLFKSSMISMATSVMLTVFLSIGTQIMSPLKKVAHLLFTSYADNVNVLNSNAILTSNNENLNITNGIICMIATIVITYAISHINFTKKDMLI